jgi:cytochrome P450
VDVQDVLERFAFDNICRVASDDGGPGVPGRGERGRARERRVHARVQRRAERRHGAVHGAERVKRLRDVEPERRMREALATVHGYADRIVRERRERGGECRDDFLSRFAAAGEHSDEGLRDVVTNFLLAGRDTTSSALTWFFWLVSTRPDVEDQIVRARSSSSLMPRPRRRSASTSCATCTTSTRP